MGNSFVFFDVSIAISHGQFHCGNRGHTKNTDFPWIKSHFPVGKRSSGTAAIGKYTAFACTMDTTRLKLYKPCSVSFEKP